METVSAAQDDSSGANPSSVKSENGSPPPDGERGSPPPNCAICLGNCRNKSFTDSCLHQFCFKCLVTWSKVKSVCPLCKQNFKSIIHNVQSNQQYEEYRVEQEEDRIDIDDLVTATRRFRYRTTLTFPRGGEQLAFHRLLMRYPPLSAMVDMSRDLPGITPAALPSSRRRRSPGSFRRTVYRHNLWARPLPDFTGRHRDCTPEFYRYNDSQMHRLVPWLSRELTYLLLENSGHIAYVLQRILELLPQYHITSPEFREEMYRFFGSRTDHFLHELHCFASTPYDLTGYDRSVQYTTDSRVYVNTVNDISSSDTDSGDSDVVEVLDAALNTTRSVEDLTAPNQRSTPLAFRPVTPILTSPYTMGPSASARSQEPVYPLNLITSPTDGNRLQQNSVIPIETISHSDTDEDEVMVTGYIKPPHQRTPEVVDLRDSDSDVVVTEPSTSQIPLPPPRFPVKLTLSRPRPVSSSDSDDETYTPPQPPPPPPPTRIRRRRRSSSDTVPSSRSSETSHSYYSSTSSSSGDEISRRNTVSQKKGKDRARNRKSKVQSSRRKRKHGKHGNNGKELQRKEVDSSSTSVASTSAAASSSANDRSSPERQHHDMRLQRKSINGKGVKSSRRNEAIVDSRSHEPMEVDASSLVPESRASDDSVRTSPNSIDVERKLARTTQTQEEPQPGPSSRHAEREKPPRDEASELPKESLNKPGSSRSSSKVGKSSRRDEPSQSKSAESRIEPEPEATLAQIRKEIKQRRRHDEESMNVNDEPLPGPSSQPDATIKSSRKDASSESRRAEPRTDPETSSRPRSKGKSSRRDESMESSSGSSSRSSGQVEQRDLPSQTIGARSSSVHDELRPESSSRHGEKRVKTSKRDLSETRKREPSTADLRSDVMRSNGKGSKSSRREESAESRASPADAPAGPSQTGPSNLKRKSSDEIPTRREHKRLKSVVKKASGSSTSVSAPSSVIQVSNASKKPTTTPDSFSDSDDDIPLNLTIRQLESISRTLGGL